MIQSGQLFYIFIVDSFQNPRLYSLADLFRTGLITTSRSHCGHI